MALQEMMNVALKYLGGRTSRLPKNDSLEILLLNEFR